ncbi:zinc-dependent alcohol dehydrogenase family protein [Bradyrhizobium sp. Arg237L]|uniref:zinc-dependent alcohol dehydrogenase family protein n=1 Tax=Bradyrhizobium sp. Arg237L TaxID=3003352 RepID=UPI00249DF7BA|nr:zinc-dependent alcohol dehydrogenase family protein [Bradyrhizobium sp. Arg237L]MDI4232019.1 zinc-dependent alcohol dehydrogenase family protein [Bradyrhizobium sp. Arg237L]
MKAIQIEAFGNPAEVMKLVDIPDVGDPGDGEVVIALEASPINMSDLLMISGRYGYQPKLPSIVGTEGVGRVVAVGRGVRHMRQGDRTLIPYPSPAWAERVKADASKLRALPDGDPLQLAMLGINPATAYLLLTDFVTLAPGAWVIQNAANSGVGRAVIGIAKSLGLKTVNVVRREEVVADLKASGGDVVLVDGPDLNKRVAAETGGAPIALAIDGVADTATMNLITCLAPKGVLVFYSAISGKPFVGPAQPFIFRDIAMRGFWLANWFNSATAEHISAMYEHLAPLVASGVISAPVEGTYRFSQIPEAVAVAQKNRGKALFTPD